MEKAGLAEAFKRIIKFLERHKVKYLVIGGIAAGVFGEPRATVDIDIDLSIKKNKLNSFLTDAEKAGFSFDITEVNQRVNETGTFRIWYEEVPIDFIIASTKFEENAFKRKHRVRIFGIAANFPSVEDLLLLKIIPARPQDKIDAENIALRHKGRVDEKYLLFWAQKLSDEAEDIRIYNEVKRLLEL